MGYLEPSARRALTICALNRCVDNVWKCPGRNCMQLGIGKLMDVTRIGFLRVLDVAPLGRIGIA